MAHSYPVYKHYFRGIYCDAVIEFTNLNSAKVVKASAKSTSVLGRMGGPVSTTFVSHTPHTDTSLWSDAVWPTTVINLYI